MHDSQLLLTLEIFEEGSSLDKQQARYSVLTPDLLLRSYWQEHPHDEDALRPLMEILGKRECYQEALASYEKLCALLKEDGEQPDAQTQDIVAYLQAKQLQRSPLSKRNAQQEKKQHAQVFCKRPEATIDEQHSSPVEDYLVRFDRSLFGGYQGVSYRFIISGSANRIAILF